MALGCACFPLLSVFFVSYCQTGFYTIALYFYFVMFSSLLILSSIGGCVRNILSKKLSNSPLFLNGLSKYRCAVASLAFLTVLLSLPIFSKAEISP